jgi:L-ribulose-5-phosphate 3-epimerase UlaE
MSARIAQLQLAIQRCKEQLADADWSEGSRSHLRRLLKQHEAELASLTE